MIRPEVEKLRGYTFTEEEMKEIIKSAIPASTDGKIAYLKVMIHEVGKKLEDIQLAFISKLPYYIAVSRKMNPFGESNSDALEFAKRVFAEVLCVTTLSDGTVVPVGGFNIENYSFNVAEDSTAGCTIEVKREQ